METGALARFRAAARFPSLDGLRALSVVAVVWHHATPGPLPGILGRGPLGVDLFFAISGFLITTLLLRERRTLGTVRVGAFYARRSLRIFPLYYLVLGAFVLHALFLRAPGPSRDHFLGNLFFHATYTSNWLVDFAVPYPVVFAFGWSLATEEQFYLAYPWLLRARSLAPAMLAMALGVAVSHGARTGALDGSLAGHPLAIRMLGSFAAPIGLGALLALALETRFAPGLAAALAWRGAAPVAFALLLLAAGWPLPLWVAHAAMVALVGAVCLRPDHGLAWLLDARGLRHLGVVSYGVYLLHVPIVVGCRRALGGADADTGLVFALGLAGSVAAATLTHRYVEQPLVALRARLRATPEEESSSGAAPSLRRAA